MKYLLTVLLSFIVVSTFAQLASITVDTTFATGDGSNPILRAIITRPAWYQRNILTDSGQVIIYCGGLGEIGTDTSKVATYGPHNWMRTQGWDGGVTLSLGVIHYPLVISLQAPAGFYTANHMGHIIDLILANYRIKRNSVHLLGISMGGWENAQIIAYRPVVTDSSFLKYARSVVDIEGVKPDDPDGAAAAYPTKFEPAARANIKFWFFEQTGDFRDGQTIVNTMNAIRPGVAFWTSTSFIPPTGAGHGGWQHQMGGNGQAVPDNFQFNGGISQNIYQWMLRNGDTVNDLHPITNVPPVCSGGPMQTIQLLTTFATLHGTASGVGGSTIASVLWSVDSTGIAINASLTSPTSLDCGVTGMNIWGNYVFRLIVTDNNGLKDTSYTHINVLPQCNTNPFVRYNLSGVGGEIFMPNGRAQPWKGGDTLVIPATGTTNNDIIFGGSNANGLSGDPCHPIIIMGPDVGQAFTSVLRFDAHCQYIKIINNPRNPIKYNIKVNTIGGSLSNNIEMSGIDVDGSALAGQGATGVIWKQHLDTTAQGKILPETTNLGYLMYNIWFHDMRVRHSDGEGWYIGPTAPNGGDGQGPIGFFPVRLRKVQLGPRIYTDSTGWDAIQLSGGLDSCTIHDDTVRHYGLVNMGSQQCGIIAGGSTQCDTYNNYVNNGTGNGIEIFGYGTNRVHDNFLDSCGRDGTSRGQESIFQNDIPSIVTADSGQRVYYWNNTIRHPQTAGAIRSNNDRGTAMADSIWNNTFCIPGASVGTYQSLYIICAPTPVFTNNTLTTSCGTIAPTVDPGSNQTITLPTNSTTLIGTTTGNGGAIIVTHTWSQISGPNLSTILTPSNTTTLVSGLVQGVYTFQLSATDNNSNTTTATMTVTVNSAIIPPSERNYFIMHEYYHKRFQ